MSSVIDTLQVKLANIFSPLNKADLCNCAVPFFFFILNFL